MRIATRMFPAAAAIAVFLLAATAAAEKPVFVEKDRLYTSFDLTVNLPSKSYFDGGREVKRDTFDREFAEQFYEIGAIFGFRDTFDFLMSFPIHHYGLNTPTGDVGLSSVVVGDRGWTRLDYVGLGFRWKVPLPWYESALETALQIPTGARVDAVSDKQYLGDGRLALTLRYLARKDYAKKYFAQGEFGVELIDERPQSRVAYALGGGAKLHRFANVGLNLHGKSAITAENDENPFQNLPKEQAWLWLQPFIYANPWAAMGDKLEVRLAFDWLLTGRNAPLSHGINFGIAYLWF